MDNFYASYSGLNPGGGGVTSLNSLTGALTLVAGTGISITPAGSNITIDATGSGGITNPLSNSVYLKWRNFANNADLNVLTVDAADSITLGTNSSAFPGFMNIFTGTSPGGNIDIQTDTVTMYGNTTNAVQMRWYAADQGNLAAIRAPETLVDSYILTLPPDDGDAGQFLQTDGTGILSWVGAANSTLSNLDPITDVNSDLIFNTGADAFIKTSDASSSLKSMNISAGVASGADAPGGSVNIISGSATGTSSDNIAARSGNVTVSTGASAHAKTGDTSILTGDSSINKRTGSITVKSGDRTGPGGFNSGEAFFLTGDADEGGSGFITIRTGAGGAGGAGSGDAFLYTGDTVSALTGSLGLKTGDAGGTANTGLISITTGAAATGTGISGDLFFATGVAAALNTGSINLGTGSNIGTGGSADTGTVQVFTGNVDPTGDGNQSGFINIFSGNAPGVTNQTSGGISIRTGSSGYQSGEVLISSGDGTTADSGFSGGTTIATGDVTGTAASGNIVLSTGTVGTGDRGYIEMRGLFARMPVGTVDPVTGITGGELYFNTGTSKLRLYDGSTWVDLN